MENRDIGGDGFSIKEKAHRSLFVAAVGFHSSLLQPLQHLAPRVSINISRPKQK